VFVTFVGWFRGEKQLWLLAEEDATGDHWLSVCCEKMMIQTKTGRFGSRGFSNSSECRSVKFSCEWRTLAPVKCKLRQGLSFTNWIYILTWILSCVSSCPPKPLESIIREVARSRQAFLSGDPSWVKDIQRTCSDSDAYEFSWCLCMLLSIAAECSIHKK